MTTGQEVSGRTMALDLADEIRAKGSGTYSRTGVRLLTEDATEARVLECIALVVAKLTPFTVTDAVLEDGTLIVEVA